MAMFLSKFHSLHLNPIEGFEHLLEGSARFLELHGEEKVFKFRVKVVLSSMLVQEVKIMSTCGWDSGIQTMSGGWAMV